MNRIIFFLMVFVTSTGILCSQEVIDLWPENQIPNFRLDEEREQIAERDIVFIQKVQKPTLEIFLPSKKNSNGLGLLILPGGGYAGVAYDWEGTDYAKWLNGLGIAAFVLKYRMPQSKSVITSHKAPIQDAQRALRYIRFHSDRFNLKSDRIGVIGSSAGGHLASTLGTHFETTYYNAQDEIDQTRCRPDFMMLIYPVISMDIEITHLGSRTKLLGTDPDNRLIDQFSNEKQINTKTPPALIIHSGNDQTVPIENSLRFYKGLLNNKIDATMHVFPYGGHGYGLGLKNPKTPEWTSHAEIWLAQFTKNQ